ncbi:hypothetical protein BDC45DRAFT_609991 [Circinella umbellata]|nr:hypothetical protein BDC45DRAFT_609991 [Circinella umbellata]
MDLLYCMPTSLHCSHKRSHSPSSHFSRPIFKKKKHVHDFSPTTLEQQVYEQTRSKQNQNCSKSSKNDITRINDVDVFLAEDNNNNDGSLSDYILLHGDKDKHLANVKLKNGVLLPMERRKGETKFRIPDFVLLNNNNNMTSSTTTTNRALIRYQDPSIINIEKRTRQKDNDGEEERMMDVDYNSSSNNEEEEDEDERNNSHESLMSMEID